MMKKKDEHTNDHCDLDPGSRMLKLELVQDIVICDIKSTPVNK